MWHKSKPNVSRTKHLFIIIDKYFDSYSIDQEYENYLIWMNQTRVGKKIWLPPEV